MIVKDESYINDIEDALLFAREKKQLHQWIATGMIIDTLPPITEKQCSVCGAVNWGGKEDGICFGNQTAEVAIIMAHNRRASKMWRDKEQKAEAKLP